MRQTSPVLPARRAVVGELIHDILVGEVSCSAGVSVSRSGGVSGEAASLEIAGGGRRRNKYNPPEMLATAAKRRLIDRQVTRFIIL
jgi:hypothetical protein